jgi:DNA repair exonuclease SbcCD nuclease subunit
MLVAFLNDSHFGVKNASDIFLNYQERFFTEIFFPYCLKHGIKKIIHKGDFYEHRKYVAIKTLNRTRSFFIEKLREYGMHMDIIPGNHDVVYKNTNKLNSLTESLQHYADVVTLYMEPTVNEYGSLRIALLPWITSDNYAKSIEFIRTADAPIIAAHLELSGFEMMKGAPVMSHGLGADLFARYEMVLTGHYHTKSTKGNIHYFGTQFELSWADANDPKYFHVIDTETRKLTQIRNPLTLFNKIFYNDNPKMVLPELQGTFVKIIVTSKKDPRHFDAFLDRVQRQDPFELKIVESSVEFSGESIDDDAISLVDTGSLLNSYVDAIDTKLDKDRIKTLLHGLYLQAQTLDAL